MTIASPPRSTGTLNSREPTTAAAMAANRADMAARWPTGSPPVPAVRMDRPVALAPRSRERAEPPLGDEDDVDDDERPAPRKRDSTEPPPDEEDGEDPPTLPAGALPDAAAARRASRAARCFWFWVWRRCLDGCRLVDMARTLGVVAHPGEGG